MATQTSHLTTKIKSPIVSTLIQGPRHAVEGTSGNRFSLSTSFWDRFVDHQWTREALLIKNPFPTSMSTSDEILVALQKTAADFEVNSAHVKWNFYRGDDGFQLEGSKLRRYVPNASDQSIAGYVKRIEPLLKGECFGLVLHELQEYHPEFYLRTREFLSDLAARVSGHWRAMTGLFIGNYELTPFGIHQDPANVFDFIIEGRKRIYIWPEDYFCDSFDKLHDSDFATLRRDATVLEGEAGDILYWPGRYWHVGESVGGLAVSASLALIPVQLSNFIIKEIKDQIDGLGESESDFPMDASDLNRTIATTVRQAINLLRRTSRDSEFVQSLQVSWLNHLTSGGSQPPPPPLLIEDLNDDCQVRGIPKLPLVWIFASDTELICSANGHSFSVPAAPAVIELLTRLNRNAPLQVGEIVKKYSGVSHRDGYEFNVTEEGLRFLLAKLYSVRAIGK
jgi:50S ribosomal protein L16 3-hydroxylase